MKNGKWELRIGSVLAGIVIFLAVLSFFWTPYGINEIDKTGYKGCNYLAIGI